MKIAVFKVKIKSFTKFYKCSIVIRCVIKNKLAKVTFVNSESLKER